MQGKTAVLLGATGLTGNHLLQLLLQSDAYAVVRVISRSAIQQSHPKLSICIIDFGNEKQFRDAIGNGDTIFCCIGTTLKNVKGDKVLYRKIDFDIAENAARYGIANGFSQFLLISAVGANANAGNFYLQLKGETENAVKAFPYTAIHIFRPSLLMGDRKEKRLLENISQVIMPAISFLLPAKYRPVHIEMLAKAMLNASLLATKGIQIHAYQEIKKLTN